VSRADYINATIGRLLSNHYRSIAAEQGHFVAAKRMRKEHGIGLGIALLLLTGRII